ncbi:tub domain-containing protein ktub [Brevipalpus obovatus]|uniref:tub domain-containing protein ktub n=1 Tax=Brevipalpus obovatus TaxID=246614 RepID=UPI003D9EDE95
MALPSGAGIWSRNLNEEFKSENKRSKLIEKQRQLLETKKSRQQQATIISTRPKSARALRPTSGASRLNEKLSTEQSEKTDSNKCPEESLRRCSIESKRRSSNTSEVRSILSSGKRNTSPSPQISPASSPETTIKQIPADKNLPNNSSNNNNNNNNNNKNNDGNRKLRSGSNPNIKVETINRSLSKSSSDIRDDVELIRELDLTDNNCELNPLKSILNSNELLLFATQTVPACKTYQCVIIRDKRGIDRSFYPTYYIHLQAIVDKSSDEKNDTDDSITKSNGSTQVIEFEKRKNSHSGSSSIRSQSASRRQVFLLGGRRRKKSKTYLIGNDPFDITRDNCVAKLKSNVLGTQFNAIQTSSDGRRYEVATIIYETNVLGFKGPRKMTVLVPRSEEVCSYPNSTLLDQWKRDATPSNDQKSILTLKNKAPVWNEETQSYVLNFHGRVTQASVKNFQLVISDRKNDPPPITDLFGLKDGPQASDSNAARTSEFLPTNPATIEQSITDSPASIPLDDNIAMQFGRISEKEFTCDVNWPLSILQAFCIALSSFDSKLACE